MTRTGRPRLPKGAARVSLTIRLTPEVIELLDTLTHETRLSRSRIVEALVVFSIANGQKWGGAASTARPVVNNPCSR